MREALGTLVHACACGLDPECPILEALEARDNGGAR